MHLSSVKTLLCLGVGVATASPLAPRDATTEMSILNSQAIELLKSVSNETESKRSLIGDIIGDLTGKCNIFNAKVRRNWADLSKAERKEYISAVRCLQTSPSKGDPSFAPGAKTRYDDFLATHINQTMTIHGTGNFLTWHRYFTWAYEQALRNECGYNGYQPYWNWFANTDDLEKSPVFDGSETSMSGNGAKIDFNGTLVSKGKVWVPPGSGGGCVTSGPFKDYTVNLGPVSPTQDGMVAVNDSLSYNPHCMQRDLSSFVATGWLTTENLLNITVGAASGSISAFQNELQGRFQDGFLGLHTAGHDVMGGTSADLSASPSDPVFFLHHSMLDRVYWIWQALHPFQAKDIAGTRSILGTGPDALKSDVQDLGTLAEPKTISQLIDTLEGPFCYVYA